MNVKSTKVGILCQEEYQMRIVEYLGLQNTKGGTDGKRNHFAVFECCSCKLEFRARCGSSASKAQRVCLSCRCKTHGMSKHPLYPVWNSIVQRCYNEKSKDYSRYGGIGVTMFKEWRDDFSKFSEWCVENGWRQGLEVDKDIKSKELGISPPVYSPDTISFVTIQVNVEFSSGKPVLQFSIDGCFIGRHVSAVAAALSLGKIKASKSSISNCCRGVKKSAFGFVWRYENE